jgi:hypothetical protein
MKLCPQCDFIYEDDQAFCDMDGKELIFNAVAAFAEQDSVSAQSPGLEKSRARRVALALAAAALLASLLCLIYLAQRRQLQNSATSVQSSTQPSLGEPVAQSSPAASIANTAIDASLQGEPNASAGASPVSSPAAEASTPAHALETSARASDAALGSGPAPVILRLTNGAVIKADDAGQTRNGVWYRQGGMVTFLKRGQVKAIERNPAPLPKTTKPANKVEKTGAGGAVVAQNPLRLKRPEPATPKSPSRVASFFKKTGQILSRPFKR